MDILNLIRKKRLGGVLSAGEIEWFTQAVTEEQIPDYQISAFLMAVMFQGLNRQETLTLTMAMANSGDRLDLSILEGITVDKHSTGGVGDKTTLVVAPLAAACGLTVAKMSGRGLGHTGGTIDKLESINGYIPTLSAEEFLRITRETGLCIAGQSGNLAPADKKLYALRDVTDTVESLPLIAASIMSKKLAAGAQCILLDVKSGSGAFMKTQKEARALAEAMVEIGRGAGRKCAALITDMSRPLGYAVGNALELQEALSVLRGQGSGDLQNLCFSLVSGMLRLAACCCDPNAFPATEEARQALIRQKTNDGSAFERLCRMVQTLGGDEDMLRHPEKLPLASYRAPLTADHSGYITAIDAESIGVATVRLGAGRTVLDDMIDHGAGILFRRTVGDWVCKGDLIAELYTSRETRLREALPLVYKAVGIGESPPSKAPLILGSVGF